MKKITIVRRRVYRFYGIANAAKALGVSTQAVSNFVSGRCPSALSAKKRSMITVVPKD